MLLSFCWISILRSDVPCPWPSPPCDTDDTFDLTGHSACKIAILLASASTGDLGIWSRLDLDLD